MKILLDSSVIIDVLRKKIGLKDDDYFVNPIVYAEVVYGFIKVGRKFSDWDRYLESKQISVVDIGINTAKIYASLKVKLRNRPIADNDLLIASSAMEYGMKLWTSNKKHFGRINGLGLL